MNALDRSIAEGYPLDVRHVLQTAWAALPGSKRILWAGAAAWLAISVSVSAATTLLGVQPALSGALGVLATTPITGGLLLAGARRARGATITLRDLAIPRAATPHLAIVLLANLLVVLLGERLLGSVGSLPVTLVYGLFTAFAPYLVVDQGLGAGAALRASVLLVRHRAGRLLALQLILGVLLAAAMLPFLIGLIWGVPFALIAQGAVYARAVGSTQADPT